MTDEAELRLALMQARGAMALAVSIRDNGGAPPEVLLARMCDTLTEAASDAPPIRLQTCPAGQHRDWLAEVDPQSPVLPCPWCDIAVMAASPSALPDARRIETPTREAS